MPNKTNTRAVAVVLLATTFALAPVLAEARPGTRGGASTSIRGGGGGGGGGGFSGGRSGGGGGGYSGARSGGGYGGGASASTRQSRGDYGGGGGSRQSGGRQTGAGSSDRMANNSGNRANTGNINSGNRVNTGNINTGNINNANINRNVNVDVDNGGWGYNDYRHPVAGAVAIGAVAGATAAIVAGSRYYALPPGCSAYPYGGYSYYHCGNVYYETRYEGDKVVYVVVDEPG